MFNANCLEILNNSLTHFKGTRVDIRLFLEQIIGDRIVSFRAFT